MTPTPKEKADELVKKMYKIMSDSVSDITLYFAKQCALVAVDEILKVAYWPTARQFWQEVRKEIEKL